jgi:predicted PurR-regulated permease PerM
VEILSGINEMESKPSLLGGSYLRWIQYIVFGGIILHFGKDVFVPLSLALLISFVLYPVAAWMEGRGMGRMASILVCVLLLMILILALVFLLINQFFGFLKEWPVIRQKFAGALNELSRFIDETYGITSEQQSSWLSEVANQSASGVISLVRDAVVASSFSVVMLVLVPVYAVLILYYRRQWLKVLYRFFPDHQREEIREVLSLSIVTYYNFIKGMAIVYLVVGILNSIGLLALGIPHALLFGFIASVLTFIPYIGIIIGSLLPITMAWITYDSVWYPLGVVGVFTFVQYLEANLIFPWAVSNRLHVNTLVTLVAVFTGGIIWGMAGLILFVPYVGILKLIADHDPKLETLSMILGQEKVKKKKTIKYENQRGMAPEEPHAP